MTQVVSHLLPTFLLVLAAVPFCSPQLEDYCVRVVTYSHHHNTDFFTSRYGRELRQDPLLCQRAPGVQGPNNRSNDHIKNEFGLDLSINYTLSACENIQVNTSGGDPSPLYSIAQGNLTHPTNGTVELYSTVETLENSWGDFTDQLCILRKTTYGFSSRGCRTLGVPYVRLQERIEEEDSQLKYILFLIARGECAAPKLLSDEELWYYHLSDIPVLCTPTAIENDTTWLVHPESVEEYLEGVEEIIANQTEEGGNSTGPQAVESWDGLTQKVDRPATVYLHYKLCFRDSTLNAQQELVVKDIITCGNATVSVLMQQEELVPLAEINQYAMLAQLVDNYVTLLVPHVSLLFKGGRQLFGMCLAGVFPVDSHESAAQYQHYEYEERLANGTTLRHRELSYFVFDINSTAVLEGIGLEERYSYTRGVLMSEEQLVAQLAANENASSSEAGDVFFTKPGGEGLGSEETGDANVTELLSEPDIPDPMDNPMFEEDDNLFG